MTLYHDRAINPELARRAEQSILDHAAQRLARRRMLAGYEPIGPLFERHVGTFAETVLALVRCSELAQLAGIEPTLQYDINGAGEREHDAGLGDVRCVAMRRDRGPGGDELTVILRS
jgi:hypothetical protein